MAPFAIDDTHLMLRFKHGIQTIFLFVDGIATRAQISTQLLRVLHDRYPAGLTTSEGTTPLPPLADAEHEEDEARVEFAVPAEPAAPSQGGWKQVDAEPDQVLFRKADIRDGACLAFRFVSTTAKYKGNWDIGEDSDEADGVEWPVSWPDPDDGMGG